MLLLHKTLVFRDSATESPYTSGISLISKVEKLTKLHVMKTQMEQLHECRKSSAQIEQSGSKSLQEMRTQKEQRAGNEDPNEADSYKQKEESSRNIVVCTEGERSELLCELFI